MECAHCHNPQAGNLEPITQRAFCNAECQRALYVKGGIFDIVATRKRTISRDVVYKLLKHYLILDDEGEFRHNSLPPVLVDQLCIMHREPVPFAQDHIDKVYDFFFDPSNAQALRHEFLWHQDKLKQVCITSSSRSGHPDGPCEEIFMKLYEMGTFMDLRDIDNLQRHFNIWYQAGSVKVVSVFLKDPVLNSEKFDMFRILKNTMKEYGVELFREVILTNQIHVKIILGIIEYVLQNYWADSRVDLFAAHIMFDKFFIQDPRIIGKITPDQAYYLFFYELFYKDNLEMVKYVLEKLNPTQSKVSQSFGRLLMAGYNRDPSDINLKMTIKELLSTNKIELDGIDRSAFSLEIQNMLNNYERARERGQGESSRKYTRMGKRL